MLKVFENCYDLLSYFLLFYRLQQWKSSVLHCTAYSRKTK